MQANIETYKNNPFDILSLPVSNKVTDTRIKNESMIEHQKVLFEQYS